jgi:hypothetical protein
MESHAGRPSIFRTINQDDYHAQHVGRFSDGRQFILTNPVDAAIGGNPGCEFVALYIFDASGTH